MELLVNANFDIIGKKKYFITASIILISIGLLSIFFHNGLNYGIDFAGGTIVQVKFNDHVKAEEVRNSLKDLNLGTYTIQTIGQEQESEFLMRLPTASETEVDEMTSQKVVGQLEKIFGADKFTVRRTESVGPAIGKELRTSAFGAIAAALIMMLIYIAFRFEFKFGVGAVVALFHDVLITIGALSLSNREIDMPVIAALLTLVGYSVNDTIVVFDRVRENLRLLHRESIRSIFNTSINQTLSRTILTSLTVFIVVLALFVFGGEVINTFAFTLLIGVIVGTYSSIYVASPLVIWWSSFSTGSAPRAAAKKNHANS